MGNPDSEKSLFRCNDQHAWQNLQSIKSDKKKRKLSIDQHRQLHADPVNVSSTCFPARYNQTMPSLIHFPAWYIPGETVYRVYDTHVNIDGSFKSAKKYLYNCPQLTNINNIQYCRGAKGNYYPSSSTIYQPWRGRWLSRRSPCSLLICVSTINTPYTRTSVRPRLSLAAHTRARMLAECVKHL